MFKIQVSPDDGKSWYDMLRMPPFETPDQADSWLDTYDAGMLEDYGLMFRVVEDNVKEIIHAPLPSSISEALNSGDGTYKP